MLMLFLKLNLFHFETNIFNIFEARLYQTEDFRHVIVHPFNWIISNNLKTSEIFVFGSQVYTCKSGSMPVYIFKNDPEKYNIKCWGGTFMQYLSSFQTATYTSIKLSKPNKKVYCVLDAINDLLDLGVLTNNLTK